MNEEKAVCSLCQHEIDAKDLHRHRQEETKEIIDYTISLIKSRHPAWVAENGVCVKCWEHYRNL